MFPGGGGRTRRTMLTSDLMRLQFSGNEVTPRYITRKEAPHYLKLCTSVLAIYQDSVGKTQSEIRERLVPVEREGDYKVIRGLVKLIEDQCVFAPPVAIDFPEYRSRIFAAAQQFYPIVTSPNLLFPKRRDEAIGQIAASLTTSPRDLEQYMFADLPESRVLLAQQFVVEPEALLHRYNLALAQAVLYFAVDVTVELESDFKTVWKYIKLARLIHEMEKTEQGYRVRLTGPLSVFKNTRRYGIRLAMLLPGFLLAGRFSMTATIMFGDSRKRFRLDQNSGLRSHYREMPRQFDSRVESDFFDKFTAKKGTGWTIRREEEVIDLGDTVLIPDFSFTHADGRRAMLEIVGFWTPEYVEKKLQKIRRAKDVRLIVALSENLNCSRTDMNKLAGKRVLFFKGALKVKDVLSCLEEM